MSDSPITIRHDDGVVHVDYLESGRKRITVELADRSTFMPTRVVETDFSLELIQAVLDHRGPAWLGYSIRRSEDMDALTEPLRLRTLAYVDEAEFDGKRLLDLGCGSGSSTVALARLFPRTEIVGVDLEEENTALARLRAAHYGLSATFHVSPGPCELPPTIGCFDFVCMTAVYEHLLPRERPVLMAKAWRVLRPGGVLFLNDTPHRYYPLEFHTTGLPLLNYLPDRGTFFVARHLSRRGQAPSWDDLLRRGIRGATEREVMATLRAGGEPATQLRPTRLGCNDQVDLWYALAMNRRPLRFKTTMRAGFKLISRLARSTFAPELTLAIKKEG